MKRRIVYVQYSNPAAYPPLMHSARILADTGWDVLVLGIKDEATRTLRFPPHPRITQRQLPRVALGWRRTYYFLYFCIWVFWHTVRWGAAWVYAADLFATPSALALSYVPNVRVVYHENDAPQVTRGLAKMCMHARKWLAPRAAVCVFPNAARADGFIHEVAETIQTRVVMNCPERAEVVSLPVQPANSFRVLYHGSIVPARLPLNAIEALALLPDSVCLRIVGYETIGHTGYMAMLLERARALGIAQRVEWVGQVPTRADLLALARECVVGLALMPMHSDDWNEQTMAGASNKPFDYLACGLGLIVSDLPDWQALFVATGFGQPCDPTQAENIANAVRWYLEHAAERPAQRERAQQKILADWNYETQFAAVAKFLA